MDKLKQFLDSQILSHQRVASRCKMSYMTLRRMIAGKPCFKSSANKLISFIKQVHPTFPISLEDFNIAKK